MNEKIYTWSQGPEELLLDSHSFSTVSYAFVTNIFSPCGSQPRMMQVDRGMFLDGEQGELDQDQLRQAIEYPSPDGSLPTQRYEREGESFAGFMYTHTTDIVTLCFGKY